MPAFPSWDDFEPAEETHKRNYFVRHWRGELPLPVAFWFNTIAGFILVAVAVTLMSASSRFKDEFAPAWMLLAICSVWLIAVAAVGWQVVGVWRSAGHTQRQKPGRAGMLAKATLAAAVLGALVALGAAGIPRMQEYRQILAADAKMEKPTLQIARDGRELAFSGGISLGVAAAFAQILSSAQSVQTVRLNSDGGRIVEAERMAALIKAKGLDTYVADECASACTTVFLAGRNRLAAPDARIGLTRANATRPDELWYPSAAELLSEKVVTRVVNPSERNQPDQGSPGLGPPRPVTGRSLRE